MLVMSLGSGASLAAPALAVATGQSSVQHAPNIPTDGLDNGVGVHDPTHPALDTIRRARSDVMALSNISANWALIAFDMSDADFDPGYSEFLRDIWEERQEYYKKLNRPDLIESNVAAPFANERTALLKYMDPRIWTAESLDGEDPKLRKSLFPNLEKSSSHHLFVGIFQVTNAEVPSNQITAMNHSEEHATGAVVWIKETEGLYRAWIEHRDAVGELSEQEQDEFWAKVYDENQKSLRKELEADRGKPFTDEEWERRFANGKDIGRNCLAAQDKSEPF